ncbi:MAG: NINE protein [Halorhabdus sp.]
MKYCINCGAELTDQADVCTECGVDQSTTLDGAHGDRSQDERYCVGCGALIYKQATVCPECGVEQPASEKSDSTQVAAGVLAILLGWLGVHKFYQGNTKNGVLYLCFFWTGIPALLGLVEGILILTADEDEYEHKYADGSILGK